MSEDALFTGIDIGSTAVRIAVGHRLSVGDKTQVHIIGAIEVPSEGINRGSINSIEDAVASVSGCIEKVEKMVGTKLGLAHASISGANVISTESKGLAIVSRPDGEIRQEDVDRAVEAAQNVATPLNYEIVHVIPKTFTVDGQKGIKDPVGMNGVRLEVDVQIIQGLSSHIKSLTRCIYRTGINLDRLVLGALATAEVVTNSRQKELGVAVVNIGASTTTMAVFEQGELLVVATLPVGSDHVTSDIAIGLRTDIDLADRVKVHHASCVAKEIARNDEINLADLGAAEDEMIPRKYVAQIVQARVEELLEKIDKELKKIGKSGMLPAGVIFTGAGAKIPELVDLAKHELRLPASLGYPLGVSSITDRVNDLSFTTAIGLVQWAINDAPEPTGRGGSFFTGIKNFSGVGGKMKKWIGALVS